MTTIFPPDWLPRQIYLEIHRYICQEVPAGSLWKEFCRGVEGCIGDSKLQIGRAGKRVLKSRECSLI